MQSEHHDHFQGGADRDGSGIRTYRQQCPSRDQRRGQSACELGREAGRQAGRAGQQHRIPLQRRRHAFVLRRGDVHHHGDGARRCREPDQRLCKRDRYQRCAGNRQFQCRFHPEYARRAVLRGRKRDLLRPGRRRGASRMEQRISSGRLLRSRDAHHPRSRGRRMGRGLRVAVPHDRIYQQCAGNHQFHRRSDPPDQWKQLPCEHCHDRRRPGGRRSSARMGRRLFALRLVFPQWKPHDPRPRGRPLRRGFPVAGKDDRVRQSGPEQANDL